MTSLEITKPGKKDRQVQPERLEANFRSSLKSITIDDDKVTAKEIISLMMQKSLESLTIANAEPLHYEMIVPEDTSHNETSSITTLNLTHINVFSTMPRYLLNLTPLLKELTCNMSRFAVPYKRLVLVAGLSPGSMADILQPVQHSLVALTIRECTHVFWPYSDGTLLDFSNFTQLKNLDVVSTCFFEPDLVGKSRKNTYLLLPRSLEVLQVSPQAVFNFRCPETSIRCRRTLKSI